MTSLAAAAEQYAEQGWRIFPLQVRGKKPRLGSHGFQDATTDLAVVRQWWKEEPRANIGHCPGPIHLVADIDGPAALRVATALGLLEDPTLTCRTGRPDFNGRHLYFQHPKAGTVIGNKRLAIERGALVQVDGKTPALELKADAGYVVIPPSIHPSGTPYQWQAVEDIRPLPPLALEAIGRDALKPAIGDTIHAGGRDVELVRIAGALWRLGCGTDMIETALQAINRHHVRPPMPETVVAAKVASVARYPRAPEMPTAPAKPTAAAQGFGKARPAWKR